MFLVPLIAGFVAGLLLDRQKALIATAVVWVAVSGLLVALSLSEDDFTIGTAVVALIGLLGFPLALLGRRLRDRNAT